ncbi:MAG: restriction endonuclease [Bacilli bacterium]|nr:restriction endonuclease [Bacilli bacterium]
MEEIKIVDNYMDEREFRNYVGTMFYKHGYYPIEMDDARLKDNNPTNDNDMLVRKDDVKYTVQTYLNTKIGDEQIEETRKDIEREKVVGGLIITNYYADKEIKEKASKEGIIILDRAEFENGIYE